MNENDFESLGGNHMLASESTDINSNTSKLMGKELGYFFMNPCEKYKAKSKIPYKLIIQLLKLTLVLIAVCIYGVANQDYTVFKMNNQEVIENIIFTQTGVYNNTVAKFYKKESLYKFLNLVRKNYYEMPSRSIGFYEIPSNLNKTACEYESHIKMCITGLDFASNGTISEGSYYKCQMLKSWNESQILDINHVPTCDDLSFEIMFLGLERITLEFNYNTMWLEVGKNHYHGKCFRTKSMMTLNNLKSSGEVFTHYTSKFYFEPCSSLKMRQINTNEYSLIFLDVIILVICASSIVLSSRSVYKASILRKSFTRFYNERYGKALIFWDSLQFFSLWHLLIIINDVFFIVGTCLKLKKYYFIDKGSEINLDSVTVLLGLGCLCMWIGLLRYVGYFHEYSKLVLTMKRSVSPILRFLVCASMLYFGFLMCGWLVLGPYHPKFRSLIVASEALFSLINGDDMYMTYEEMNKKSFATWVFSQIFLYLFISLFIYLVLSAFIAVIEDEYDGVNEWDEEGRPPQSVIEKVLKDLSDENPEEDYNQQDTTYCCICCYHNSDLNIDSNEETLVQI